MKSPEEFYIPDLHDMPVGVAVFRPPVVDDILQVNLAGVTGDAPKAMVVLTVSPDQQAVTIHRLDGAGLQICNAAPVLPANHDDMATELLEVHHIPVDPTGWQRTFGKLGMLSEDSLERTGRLAFRRKVGSLTLEQGTDTQFWHKTSRGRVHNAHALGVFMWLAARVARTKINTAD